MPTTDCTVSLVVYNNPPEILRNVCNSLFRSSCNVRLQVVDNSPDDRLKKIFSEYPCHYHFADCNLGYGKAHNLALFNAEPAEYHLVLNPDVIVEPGTLQQLLTFMNDNPDIGMVCPKVLNNDGSLQFLNKKLPAVFDLFARRFIPAGLQCMFQKRLDRYEMKDVGYDDICDVEFMSGCFMFCRTEAIKAAGGFDDRYFMYLEDCDLSRKIQQQGYRTVYNPSVSITHLWERASHKSLKMTLVHFVSACKYFNKWGWKLM